MSKIKSCIGCKIERPINLFYLRSDGIYEARCKFCQRKRKNLDIKIRRATINGYIRNENLQRKYGIHQSDYDVMYLKQEGRCAICNEFKQLLCVDHKKDTKQVRGLLCDSCNKGIAFMKDDPNILKSAIDYLIINGESHD